MIERKFGDSGYNISDFSPEDGGVYRVTFHTKTVYVTLMLSPNEIEQLGLDVDKALYST